MPNLPLIITLGNGLKHARGRRAELPRNVDFLALAIAEGDEPESWWSAHRWTDDTRAKAGWEACSSLVVDVDWHDRDGKHASAPSAAVDVLSARLAEGGPWLARLSFAHTTPRGARLIWLLDQDVTDPVACVKAHQVACDLAAGFVEAIEVDGGRYEVDARATLDLARLYFTPFARGRSPQVYCDGADKLWTLGELSELCRTLGLARKAPGRPTTVQREARAKATNVVWQATGDVKDVEIAQALEARPAEGPGDGSLELIQLCRYAIGLGVSDADRFVVLAGAWNARREEPWSVEAMAKRFADAAAKWQADGLAAGVPAGRYTRPGLETILRDDREFGARLTWNDLEDEAYLGEERISDALGTRIEASICTRYGWPSIPKDALWTGLEAEAKERRHDPIAEYLLGLEWDGKGRLDALPRRLAVLSPDEPLARAYLRKALIAAVARALEPGCKHDHIPVLVGPDRALKSSLIRTLAGERYFSDAHVDLESKDGMIGLKGVWLYEWSEIDGVVKKADLSRMKAYVSAQFDRYRPPYGRTVVKQLRRCAFWGTSNNDDLLFDPSSNRRFWILEVDRGLDLAWVRENRDQIWAEAVVAFARGEKWWLENGQEEARENANSKFAPMTGVEERVARFVAECEKRENWNGRILPSEFYAKMGIETHNVSQMSRVSRELKNLGWEKTRDSTSRFWIRQR